MKHSHKRASAWARAIFSLIMVIMVTGIAPLYAQDNQATPEGGSSATHIVDPVTDIEESETGAAPTLLRNDVQPLATTKVIGLTGSTAPARCATDAWLFTLLPDPGPDVKSATVTFTNGATVVAARSVGNNRANFRTTLHRDSTVALVAVEVPADFTATSFVVASGPCNAEPLPGEYAVTIKAKTSDAGSAEGALVSIADLEGTVVVTGAIGAGNTFDSGKLSPGFYTVSIDGWPANYNRVNQTFTISSADRTITINLTRLVAGTIEIQAGESIAAGSGRIQGADVTIRNLSGDIVAHGITDNGGVFLSSVLPPSIYSIVVDGSPVGYSAWSGDVSNERGGHIQGVVLRKLEILTVTGTVTDADTGLPIHGATVAIEGTSITTTTDASGDYVITDVTEGSYTFAASVTGYASQQQSATIADGSTVVDFELVQIPPVPTPTQTPITPATPVPTEPETTPEPTKPVTGLPKTGQGSSTDQGSLLLIATATVAIASVGAALLRKHHTV